MVDKVTSLARQRYYYEDVSTDGFLEHYESCITSEESYLKEWWAVTVFLYVFVLWFSLYIKAQSKLYDPFEKLVLFTIFRILKTTKPL